MVAGSRPRRRECGPIARSRGRCARRATSHRPPAPRLTAARRSSAMRNMASTHGLARSPFVPDSICGHSRWTTSARSRRARPKGGDAPRRGRAGPSRTAALMICASVSAPLRACRSSRTRGRRRTRAARRTRSQGRRRLRRRGLRPRSNSLRGPAANEQHRRDRDRRHRRDDQAGPEERHDVVTRAVRSGQSPAPAFTGATGGL